MSFYNSKFPFLFFRTLSYDSRSFPVFPANSCSIAYYHLRKNWPTGLGMWVKYYSSFAVQNGTQTNLFACRLGLKIVKFIEIQHLPTCYLDHIRIQTKLLAAARPLLCWKCNEMLATLSILADTQIQLKCERKRSSYIVLLLVIFAL